jgi:hypothetical protein
MQTRANNASDEAQLLGRHLMLVRKTPISASTAKDARCLRLFEPLRGRAVLFRPAVVEILSATLALVVVASSAAEGGLTKQVGGSFTGTGETLQRKLTVPVKSFVPVTVIIEDPV